MAADTSRPPQLVPPSGAAHAGAGEAQPDSDAARLTGPDQAGLRPLQVCRRARCRGRRCRPRHDGGTCCARLARSALRGSGRAALARGLNGRGRIRGRPREEQALAAAASDARARAQYEGCRRACRLGGWQQAQEQPRGPPCPPLPAACLRVPPFGTHCGRFAADLPRTAPHLR